MDPVYEKVTSDKTGFWAEPVPFDYSRPDTAETLCSWLIDAPGYSPAWSQYGLFCVRLRDDVPGFPPPKRKWPGATHEVIVCALNPKEPPHTGASIAKTGRLPFLTPLNWVEQFEGTDDEMAALCSLLVQGVVHGVLIPEPEGIIGARDGWLRSATKTLAHIRGEEHAP